MRAAEDDDARPRRHDGREVEPRGLARDLVLGPPLLRERDEERAGDVHHRAERVERADRPPVGVGGDGRLRGEDGDRRFGRGPGDAAGRPERGAGPRLDDAEDRDLPRLLDDRVEGEGRGRVARDDESLHAAREEERDGAARVTADRLGRLRAVGQARGVSEVEEVLGGEPAGDGVEDGQSSDAGVEEADGAVVGHVR